jgi:hypothetical protein
MWTYHHYAEEHGWHPREVDQLDLDELFWLPVMSGAKARARETASEQLRDRPLSY